MYVIVNTIIVILRVLYRTEKINKKFFQSINLCCTTEPQQKSGAVLASIQCFGHEDFIKTKC
jgi:hypothetical protein